jgi:hypothetical protein
MIETYWSYLILKIKYSIELLINTSFKVLLQNAFNFTTKWSKVFAEVNSHSSLEQVDLAKLHSSVNYLLISYNKAFLLYGAVLKSKMKFSLIPCLVSTLWSVSPHRKASWL